MRQTGILRRATRLRSVVRSAAVVLVPVLLIALLLAMSLALGSRTLSPSPNPGSWESTPAPPSG
ncbi:hypothetical protein [Actinomyces sp. oral taxon 448]|uniref:hypothetical protein n=1 Tax=Actinomyces sp. oral taxon 448 TaxID=712124 RepID=UPI000218A2EF|nr:hypothetical protein [Actinomyces sp. oral taxon 448]EGQ73696.1 hypothetical protein HMPREF9062_1693 [Actinomyces sp. oral taxon 448 str. F0400]